jgi:hypothetical protein
MAGGVFAIAGKPSGTCRLPSLAPMNGRFVNSVSKPTSASDGADEFFSSHDSPTSRPISPVGNEPVIPVPEVGGLHHRYERRAA